MPLEGDTLQDSCFSSDTTDVAGTSISESQSPIMHFVHFLSACSTHIDVPLEEALQQSIELAQFIDTSSSLSFLPYHQMQIRCALWELIRNARVREQYASEMEKQSRLYGSHSIAFQPNRHSAGTSVGKGVGNRPNRMNDESSSASTLLSSTFRCADPLATSDRSSSGGCRAPGHAPHCPRLPGPRPPAMALTADCALCAGEGLLRAAWVALRCGQLIGVAAAAHLCAAPLRVPREALTITPREAMCIGHHLAQQQLRCAVGLLLTVAQPPAQESEKAEEKRKNCHCKEQIEEENGNMEVPEREHNVEVITAIGRAGLDTCVMLLSALRRLQPSSAPLVLLQATAIAFCDRRGVSRAQRLLQEWCHAQALHLSDSHTPQCTANNDSNGNNNDSGHDYGKDDYNAWPRLDSPEDVVTGVLFSVFLQLLSLRESPLRDAPLTATACLCARNALDTIVHPRLLILCDAADGAASARGRQALALHWLLRGTLCHILNAFAVAPTSLFAARRVSIAFDEAAPMDCVREAVRAAEGASEFSLETLAPSWIGALSGLGESHSFDPAGDGRLACGSEGIAQNPISGEAEDALCVTELALLPVPVMRIWIVLAVAVFRSASGDLLAADNADSAASAAARPTEVAAPELIGTLTGKSTGSQTKTAKELAKRENAQRMAEVQRMAEASSLAFWHRWREIMAPMASSSCCSSSSRNELPVFERQRRLMLFACSEEREENVTMFMSALRDVHPIATSSEAAFAATQLLPQRANKEDKEVNKESEEPSLAVLDARLDAACRLYNTQCVRPLMDNALPLPPSSSESKVASGSAMRAVQQKQRVCSTALKNSRNGNGRVTRLGAAAAAAEAAAARKEWQQIKNARGPPTTPNALETKMKALKDLQGKNGVSLRSQIDISGIEDLARKVLKRGPQPSEKLDGLFTDTQTEILREIQQAKINTNQPKDAAGRSVWKTDGRSSLSYRAAVISEHAQLPSYFEDIQDLISGVMHSAEQL